MVSSADHTPPREGVHVIPIGTKPAIGSTNPDETPTSPEKPQSLERVNDGWARLIGIPVFGLTIPHFAGLFGPLTPRDGWFWFGTVWFVLLAFVIWQGNRSLLFVQRRHVDWFQRPFYKLLALVFACTIYTAPLTIGWLYAWYVLAGIVVDTEAIRVVALTNVICVLFVTHAYETVFLIKERSIDTVMLADLNRTVTQARLYALQQQVDPHFLFNALNTMSALIERAPAAATRFNHALAEVYRYLLDDRPLVSLEQELAFVRAYAVLLEIRFEGAISIEQPTDAPPATLPPTAVQALLENAVKHTRFDAREPLTIRVTIDGDVVVVTNPHRPKALMHGSSGVGLANLDERCRMLLGRGIDRSVVAATFSVRVPFKRMDTE